MSFSEYVKIEKKCLQRQLVKKSLKDEMIVDLIGGLFLSVLMLAYVVITFCY